MPSASRRKAKKAKKLKTLTIPNHHSSSAVQLQQGVTVFANRSEEMDESLNGTFQDTHRVESLSEDKEVADDDKSHSGSPDGDLVILDVDATQIEENKELIESAKVEETEDVSESVEIDAIKYALVDNAMVSDSVELQLELELKEEEKEEKEEYFLSDQAVADDAVKETDNEPSSVSGNEGLRETQVVETVIMDMTVAEEDENVLSSVVMDELLKEGDEVNDSSSMPLTDVASKENVDNSIIEKSLDPSMDEKVGEPSDVQGESSYETAEDKDSFQSSPNVQDAEVVPRSTENPTIDPVTERQHTSWKSCCGLFEIMRGGDR